MWRTPTWRRLKPRCWRGICPTGCLSSTALPPCSATTPDDLEKIDIWDESLWYLCNPSLGKHLRLRNIRMEAKDAHQSEAAEKLFRWLRLNQWISVKAVGWISLSLYDQNAMGSVQAGGPRRVAGAAPRAYLLRRR